MAPRKKGNDAQFTLRLPSELKDKCEFNAKIEGKSLNDYFNFAISSIAFGDSISIPKELHSKLDELVKSYGYGSVERYVIRILESFIYDKEHLEERIYGMGRKQLDIYFGELFDRYIHETASMADIVCITDENLKTDYVKRCNYCGCESPTDVMKCPKCGLDISDTNNFAMRPTEELKKKTHRPSELGYKEPPI